MRRVNFFYILKWKAKIRRHFKETPPDMLFSMDFNYFAGVLILRSDSLGAVAELKEFDAAADFAETGRFKSFAFDYHG